MGGINPHCGVKAVDYEASNLSESVVERPNAPSAGKLQGRIALSLTPVS